MAIAACELYSDEDVMAEASELRKLASLEAYKLAVGFLLRTGLPAKAGEMLRREAKVHATVDAPHNVASHHSPD